MLTLDARGNADVAEDSLQLVDATYRFCFGTDVSVPFCCGTEEESEVGKVEDLAFCSVGGEKRKREGRTLATGGELSPKGAEREGRTLATGGELSPKGAEKAED